MPGPLALVGGGEFTDGCTFDRDLLAASGGDEVVVIPTGAAYEHPQRLVDAAATWFEGLGGRARGLDVLRRPDALDPANVAVVRDARFLYLVGESPLHVRSVLKDTPVWDAIVAAWDGGTVLAGSVAGAMVCCDPMVDPRGGAFTLGLGLLANIAVIPEFDTWSEDAVHRTRKLSPADLVLVGVPQGTALLRDPDGSWRSDGVAQVSVFRGGEPAGLDALT
jgi:cyanophycinase